MSQTLSLGRFVHYRLPDRHGHERLRPALVVQAFNVDGPIPCANLTVFLDAANDGSDQGDLNELRLADGGSGLPSSMAGEKPRFMHPTSVHEGTDVGSFRWPAFVPPKAVQNQPHRELKAPTAQPDQSGPPA